MEPGHVADTVPQPPTLTNRIIVAGSLFTVSLIGILGNSLVVAAVCVSKKLRTTTNAFVTNLAVADLITSLFLPVLGISLLSSRDTPLPDALCGTAIGFVQVCLGCSLYSLASIAINRLLLIAKPISFYRRVFRRNNMIVYIFVTWMISISITCVPIILDRGQLGFDEEYHICGGVSDHRHSAVYESILVIGLYPLPLLAIIVSYTWLFSHIHRHQRNVKRTAKANRPVSAVSGGNPTTSQSGESNPKERSVTPCIEIEIPSDIIDSTVTEDVVTSKTPSSLSVTELRVPDLHHGYGGHFAPNDITRNGASAGLAKDGHGKRNYELQITRNLFIVVCGFLLCQTPYFAIFLFNVKGAPVLYAALAVFSNSAVNPLIYAFKHPHFRSVFKCMLLCKLYDIPERADFVKSIGIFSRGE